MSITRRSFLGSLAGGSLALLSEGSVVTKQVQAGARGFAYVACSEGAEQGIHAFRVEGERWTRVQVMASDVPSALALSPDGQSLFAAGGLRSLSGLPAGSVESFRIDRRSGRLSSLSRRSLSLAATGPEHLAVAPDGKSLLVAATEGGCYNVFPIGDPGSLEPVCCVRKELGFGAHPVYQASAHPGQIVFDSRQRAVASDLGADTLSVLMRRDGLLTVSSRVSTRPGMGPRRVVLDRTESVVVVGGGLTRSVAAYRYDVARGVLEQAPAWCEDGASAAGAWTALVAHGRRDLLLGTWSDGARSGVVCWRLDLASSSLRRVAELCVAADLTAMSLPEEGGCVLVTDARAGRVRGLRCDPESGELAWGPDVATVPRPIALAFYRA